MEFFLSHDLRYIADQRRPLATCEYAAANRRCWSSYNNVNGCNINETILWSFVNVLILMMGKLSNEDKMRIQTLREQGLGAKAISYPDKAGS